MESGGVAKKVLLVRAGAMVPAKKDTYRREYLDNGKFHYPKIPANLLRKKGELYFKPSEITGSNDGTATNPKYSMLRHFRKKELAALDACAAEYTAEHHGGVRVVGRYGWDSAGPHQCQKLNGFLQQSLNIAA